MLGGATIYFHSEAFIKWKPSVLYWIMALALALSPLLAGKNLVKALMGAQLELPEPVWSRLNVVWVLFFAVMGAINLWVALQLRHPLPGCSTSCLAAWG